MNNKGFAISTMLYGLIIIIALVMMMILSTMAFSRKTSREFSSALQNELENMVEKIEVGDYISMTPTLTYYGYGGSGIPAATSINPSNLSLWRVLKIDDSGIEAISHYVSPYSVSFYGTNGYANYVGVLNDLAKAHQNTAYTKNGRMVGYKGQTERITSTGSFDDTSKRTNCSIYAPLENLGGGDTLYIDDVNLVSSVYGNMIAYSNSTDTVGKEYFISSRGYSGPQSSSDYPFCYYSACKVTSSGTINCSSDLRYYTGSWNNGGVSASIRPIILFNPDISPTGGKGTKENPYTFS